MKQILITGLNSYIGNKFEEWVKQWPNQYNVSKISLRNDDWRKSDWTKYDVLVNVAGVAHTKETERNQSLYYKVNKKLAIDVANKAKKDKVSHFIQISTMSIFGKESGIINHNTAKNPQNHYGTSKLEADNEIMQLDDDYFKVSIVRPPMVYGKNSPGNYQKLSKFIKKVKLFPKINNRRSMIYVDNLSEFIIKIIDNQLTGFFYPQNTNYVNIFEMAQAISNINKTALFTIPNLFNWTNLLSKSVPQANKVFGELIYDKELSRIYDKENDQLNYNVMNFEESMRITENEI